MVSIPHQIETKCLTRVKSIYGMRKEFETTADSAFARPVVFRDGCKDDLDVEVIRGIEAQIAIQM